MRHGSARPADQIPHPLCSARRVSSWSPRPRRFTFTIGRAQAEARVGASGGNAEKQEMAGPSRFGYIELTSLALLKISTKITNYL